MSGIISRADIQDNDVDRLSKRLRAVRGGQGDQKRCQSWRGWVGGAGLGRTLSRCRIERIIRVASMDMNIASVFASLGVDKEVCHPSQRYAAVLIVTI